MSIEKRLRWVYYNNEIQEIEGLYDTETAMWDLENGDYAIGYPTRADAILWNQRDIEGIHRYHLAAMKDHTRWEEATRKELETFKERYAKDE